MVEKFKENDENILIFNDQLEEILKVKNLEMCNVTEKLCFYEEKLFNLSEE